MITQEQVVNDIARYAPALSVADAAAYLGIKPATLYNWRSEGKGPRWVRVGLLAKYRLADLQEWVQQQTETRT